MNGESSDGAMFDLRGILVGAGWGLVFLLLAGIIQGAIGHGAPLTVELEQILAMLWQGMAALVGGLVAGRRAPVAGWLHGALAGLLVIMAVTLTMGVVTAMPSLMDLMKMGGIGMGLGAVGGVAGVGSR